MTKEKLPLPAASFILQLILVMNLLLQILNRFEIIPHRKYLLASMSLLLFIFSVWEFRKVFLVHDFFGSITFPVGLDKAVTKHRESRASEYLKLIA